MGTTEHNVRQCQNAWGMSPLVTAYFPKKINPSGKINATKIMPIKEIEMATTNPTEGSNRARVVANVVREACIIMGSQGQNDALESARQMILNNKLLTEAEKNAVLDLFQSNQPKQPSSSSSSSSSSKCSSCMYINAQAAEIISF
ncbi:14102_t:CDS:2 [Funneliformis mosseae]|uniref:14102_t:CDS:1 n=1 Tax=Funneliformis mosseae TaxID=27381 RepID=A0A9N9CT52_FUNMO|nr:14102_t:CDS:2 [Funneliformis mosseae]